MSETIPVKRSQATQGRILEAARTLFSEVGYEHCTVREVAARADIHPSLVMRYFKDKEGLFAAAMVFDLKLPDLSVVPPEMRGRALIEHFIKRWEGPVSGMELPALLRIATTHPQGKEQIAEILQKQLAPALRKVVPADRAKLCTALIATQAIGLAFTRYVIQLPGVVALTVPQIIDGVGPTFQSYLDAR